ncbi:Acyl-coenzyme A synthetase acsm5, mitochondrial [Saguinus oedipus]|uniref:medium-chain acyl-CoA ligase n=1 Tax=Saguinus oedipus TaxID=9490 RepID=A0ABQ9UKN9_SAGOE|nr:Acyl-coenzyme A synthetase acsm5, mitochondrial [Saguinus oedipus]
MKSLLISHIESESDRNSPTDCQTDMGVILVTISMFKVTHSVSAGLVSSFSVLHASTMVVRGIYRAYLREDKESRPAGHLLHQRNNRGPQNGRALPEQLRTGRWVALTESDIFWNTTDTGWVKAAWTLFSAWPNGSCIFVHELPQVDAKVILNTLSTFPITTLCCVPTIFRLLVQEDLTRCQFQSLRHCLTGGEALNPDVREKWKRQTGVELYEGYGQSETVVICANPKGMKIKSGSMGKASPPYDVQVAASHNFWRSLIVDDEGNVLPPGEEGNVAVRIRPTRPFCFFNCYLDNPEKTAASEQGDFYITGDRAHMDKDGYFWFMGRNDDVINSSSYRIGPVEVESALAEHPAVLESAVVSSPDPIRGEVVKAFVVLTPAYLSHDPEALTRELQEHVKRVTAPYKYPRKVAFVSELPKTVSGKIQRSKLRSQEWGK